MDALNVVLIILDAARAMSFSAYGNPRQVTPFADRLASEGLVYEQAHTPAVYTLGAMYALWTSSRPPFQAQIGDCAALPQVTLSDQLTADGILTAGFITNPMAGKLCGLDRGFTQFTEEGSRKADFFAEAVPPWLSRNKARRFFLYLHFREPHYPYLAPPPYNTLFDNGETAMTRLRGLYEGNLAFADHSVGQVLAALKHEGLWESTVVILTADHGEEFGEHGGESHGYQLFDETTRVPLIVRVPRGPRGRVAAFVDLLDIAPTIAGLFGIRLPTTFTGKSLLPPKSAGKPYVMSQTVQGHPKRLPLPEPITPEQCERIKALGYVNTSCR